VPTVTSDILTAYRREVGRLTDAEADATADRIIAAHLADDIGRLITQYHYRRTFAAMPDKGGRPSRASVGRGLLLTDALQPYYLRELVRAGRVADEENLTGCRNVG
jgi:hypothetical protein